MSIRRLFVLCLSGLLFTGCVGQGETVPIHLKIPPGGAAERLAEGLTVAVVPFEDKRGETHRLGRRQHVFGGETYFALQGERPGETIAQAFAESLSRRGWRASMVKSGETLQSKSEAGPDVIINGQIHELTANADSKLFRTNVTVKGKMTIEAKNTKDGSVVRFNKNGTREQTVPWFSPDAVQDVLNTMLQESVDQFLSEIKVERGALQER